MRKNTFLILGFLMFTTLMLSAQLVGTLKDISGNPLPFASIYIKGTNSGTFSNEEGQYKLKLKMGANTIIYKYVGYASKKIIINNTETQVIKNIVLETDDVILNTVVIHADTEDPAYPIIRNAINAKRKFNYKPENFKSKIYQKFKLELLDAPEKIMGIKLNKTEEDKKEMEDILNPDNNILIVTETISNYNKGIDKQWKETIISSKMSGDNKSYSNMSSLFTKLNFYNNFLSLGRKMISPISTNALLFYNFKLVGTFSDSNGNIVNKIKVIPKRKYDPVFSGYIFITNNIWNIHSIDLTTNSKNTNIRLLDTIKIKQDFKQLTEDKMTWGLSSQYTSLTISAFGFKAKGYHTRNFTNYNLNQIFPDGFFGNIKIKVEKESNKRDSIYWERVRPIPLSIKERKGYFKMDSIEALSSSKEYLDSIDRVNNKLSYKDLLFSYKYKNSFKNNYWLISSPFIKLNFNPIQGINSNINLVYKNNREDKRFFKITTSIDYGLADKEILPKVGIQQMLNNKSQFEYLFEIGRKYVQPSEKKIMTTFINSLTSLFQGNNNFKLYQKDYINFIVKRNFISGIKADVNIEYSQRNPLKNNTDFMFITDHYYNPNIYEKNDNITFKNKMSIGFTVSFKLGTKYIDMPYAMNPIYSNSPWFYIKYNKAIGFNNNHVSYSLLKAGIHGHISTGLLGTAKYHLEGGKFLTQTNVDIIDDIYFPGNDRYYISQSKYKNSFHLIPFYYRSNFKPYFTFKFGQYFKGLIISKIPLLNKLKAEEVFTFNLLQLQDKKTYFEFGAGLNKILGYVSIRYSWAFKATSYYDQGFTFSFNIPVSTSN